MLIQVYVFQAINESCQGLFGMFSIIHNHLPSKTKHWKKLFRYTLKIIHAISKEM